MKNGSFLVVLCKHLNTRISIIIKLGHHPFTLISSQRKRICFEPLTEIRVLASSVQPVVNVEDRVLEIGIFELKGSGNERLSCIVKYVDSGSVPLFESLGFRDCQNFLAVLELNHASLAVFAAQISLVGVVQVEVIGDKLVDKANEGVRHDRFPHFARLLVLKCVCYSAFHVS